MSDQDIRQIFSGQTADLEERLRRYARELVIDARDQVRGTLPNRNLAPLQLIDTGLFEGLLPLERGGTNADLSNTGPGVLFQAASGADVTVGDLPFPFIDFSADAGAINQILVSDGAGGAFFSGVDLTSPNWRTGLLPPSAGGTGVNNSTRTLTISTNSGTLNFSAASKVLTIADSGTIDLNGLTLEYDQGTYTPTYQGLTTGGATTYTTQQGAWTKIGRVVIATGAVVWTAASGTGIAIVSLPFTAANVAGQFYAAVSSVTGVTFANSAPNAQIAPNTAYFFLVSPLSNASPGTPAVEAAGNIVFTVVYFV